MLSRSSSKTLQNCIEAAAIFFHRSTICLSICLPQIIDQLATDKSQYQWLMLNIINYYTLLLLIIIFLTANHCTWWEIHFNILIMWIHFHCYFLRTDQIQVTSLAVKSYQHDLKSSLLYFTNTLQHKQRFFCFYPLWEKQWKNNKKGSSNTLITVSCSHSLCTCTW